MDVRFTTRMLALTVILTLMQLKLTSTWQVNIKANLVVPFSAIRGVKQFLGEEQFSDHFKVLYADGQWLLLGARNKIHNISMSTLEENVLERIEWEPRSFDKTVCKSKVKTEEECQNYIRVFGKKPTGELYVCGTNAFKPKCRTYKKSDEMTYVKIREDDGVGQCPFDPEHNSTSVYSDGKLYSATVADFSAQDPLILKGGASHLLRTEQHDSKWLNDPDFVNSFDIGDKIYFFFKETAVEHINCGKAVFSRVGRVCKTDQGGQYLMSNVWTSFFKARLNCSIPGDYPFYFDEIQSTSDYGQGNYMSTKDSANRTNMFYAVFRTPDNIMRASAVCAFRYSDIVRTFEGKFKGQESPYHNWLAVPRQQTPTPHPQSCVNDTKRLTDVTLNFIKSHTLMDEAVPAAGGMPVFVMPTTDSGEEILSLIKGDDGRVIKAINKGRGSEVETVVIEDIQVFPGGEAVRDLRIHGARGLGKLVVVSKDSVVSIPLHQCEQQKTCRSCVKLQDPYCSWVNDKCAATDRGLQNILEGKHEACGPEEGKLGIKDILQISITEEDEPTIFDAGPLSQNDKNDKTEPKASSQSENNESSLSVAETAIAIVVSIVLSSIASFILGYKVRDCRGNEEEANNTANFAQDYYGSLTKNHNKFKDNEPRYINHSQLQDSNINNSQKQLNLLVKYSPKESNLPNGSAPQKPISNIPTSIPDKTYV
ncbi:hypothetical protein FSP39_016173 [Pinctada imbricata]|uniref:Semaphorin-2A n=1 Tax=Pinctada imbricata TaxID=66713 RepID=A0AA88YEW1_PINIB|nr:hypothetical protein FSP39_016173 [Pinctada imbricata]